MKIKIGVDFTHFFLKILLSFNFLVLLALKTSLLLSFFFLSFLNSSVLVIFLFQKVSFLLFSHSSLNRVFFFFFFY
uniref:Uncharacterized protein n=1 Tax=Phakopsora pachyrhizi TaxID=170000 RepID=A0A0S1MJQ5_PHAPC